MTLLDRLRAAGHAAIGAHRQVQQAYSDDVVHEAGSSPLEQQRAEIRASLAPATLENVLAAFAPARLSVEEMEARERADREAREQREQERLRRTRIRYEINLTAEQWLLLVKHGHDPLLPPNGMRSTEPHVVLHGLLIGYVDGRPVYEPLRRGVCELEGVEIDGHEPSDLDPFGGCMHCGKQEIYGDDDDGRLIRYDEPLDS